MEGLPLPADSQWGKAEAKTAADSDLYCVPCIVPCTVCTVLCALYCVRCTVCPVLCALYCKPAAEHCTVCSELECVQCIGVENVAELQCIAVHCSTVVQ